jgi:hypothetical protein
MSMLMLKLLIFIFLTYRYVIPRLCFSPWEGVSLAY